MTTLLRTSFVLCAIVSYSYCHKDSEQNARNNILIGGVCERDRDCIENAFCRVQLTCLCDPFYSSSFDNTMCIATAGLNCEDDSVCRTMSNAECKQGVCACKDDFFLDNSNSSNCIRRPVNIGDQCQVQAVCQDSFELALCIDQKCQCFTGHHYVNATRSCVPSRGLYYSCNNDYECYMNNSPDIMECKNKQCVCKEGEQCARGTLITAAGTLVTILLLLQLRIA